jgi:hypothetical protein
MKPGNKDAFAFLSFQQLGPTAFIRLCGHITASGKQGNERMGKTLPTEEEAMRKGAE